jgi:hypothetical protein
MERSCSPLSLTAVAESARERIQEMTQDRGRTVGDGEGEKRMAN